MNPKPDFEESLSRFEMAPLPEDWREELIDNALSESPSGRIVNYPAVMKLVLIGVAACWVAIGVLSVLTPAETNVNAGYPSLASEEIPLLVDFFENRYALNPAF
ncbi:MAG: hypothetical protein P1V20_14665 [Verrucomicrobiales bacterium]|nr:hypothetical protein [Verrucomicrobiales bacterium]